MHARRAYGTRGSDSGFCKGGQGVHGKNEQGSHWPGELGDSSRAAGGISSMWLGPEGEEARERVARLGLHA